MTAGVARNAPVSSRAMAFRQIEDDYIALRLKRHDPRSAASVLGLTLSTQERLEGHYRAQSRYDQTDGSSPAYAHHDRHVDRIMASGGFLRFAWRKTKTGKPIFLDARGKDCSKTGEPLGKNA